MPEGLEIVSLGGSGGFGLNATLFIAGKDALLVDFGSGFPHGIPAGVTRLVPDAHPALPLVERLAGIVVTHGHDDHHAALPCLPSAWSDVPVHAPPLALRLIEDRFRDLDASPPPLVPMRPGEVIELAPFKVRAVHVTHSIPQSHLLAIDTPAGRVVHSGDFRLDPAPVIGGPSDLDTLAELGREGVDLLLCDSTGALRDEVPPSEASVARELERAIADAPAQVVVSTFASQLHRLQALVRMAPRLGRKIAFLGMRMSRLTRHGAELRIFDAPAGVVVTPQDLHAEPPRRRMWLAGGCQGEPDSTLSRLSHESSNKAAVEEGDRLVLTSSIVPGCEVPVGLLVDRFLRLGVDVVDTRRRRGLHASGHAARPDLARLIELLAPRALMPVHGDHRHLVELARLAEGLASPPRQIEISEMGARFNFESGKLRPLEPLAVHPMALDDQGLRVPHETVLLRRRLSEAGLAVVLLEDEGRRVRIEPIAAEHESVGSLRRAVEEELIVHADASESEQDSAIARRVGSLLRGSGRRRTPVFVLRERETWDEEE